MSARSLVVPVLVVIVLLAGDVECRGQNLLTNPHFTTNLSGWSSSDAHVVPAWSPVDANGTLGSGSVLLTQPGIAGGFLPFFGQCVSVTAGTDYQLGARFRLPSGQAVTAGGMAYVVWYSAPSCASGASISSSFSVRFLNAPPDTWLSGTLKQTAPATAVSAQFLATAFADQNAASFQAHFDDLLLSAESSVTLTIPASASIHGLNAAFFHSDLWAENRSYSYPITVTARHRCLTGQTCGSGTKTFTLQPRQPTMFADVIASLFGDPETAGAVELTYDSALGNVSALSRVYTPSLPSPTYGASLPALPASDARARTLFLGLGGNGGNLSSGFRTNAGVYHPNPTTATTVTFTVYAADGSVIGTPYTRTWQPNEAFQLNDIFGVVGAAGTVTTNASLVVTSTLPVFSYVTVVDNQSGDSTIALPTADEPVPQ